MSQCEYQEEFDRCPNDATKKIHGEDASVFIASCEEHVQEFVTLSQGINLVVGKSLRVSPIDAPVDTEYSKSYQMDIGQRHPPYCNCSKCRWTDSPFEV